MKHSPVALNFEESGGGLPVIIMHGLFGSLANWRGVARNLADTYRVINIDLRNHGRSPWAPDLSYEAMAADVLALMDRLGLERVKLLGHSLGGKLAMLLADQAPERFTRLVVVDIAPKAYPAWHQDIFAGLRAVDLDHLTSREQARSQMGRFIFDPEVRAFLAANLSHDKQTGQRAWRWRFNLDVLQQYYTETSQMPGLQGFFCGPALFVRGAGSAYIEPDDRSIIIRDFPGGCLHTLKQAKHWPHIEDPQGFMNAIRPFFINGCKGINKTS
ncbi:MAG: hypothetical protein B7X35_04585 [Halothiobacillus sp. 14-56-357]|jgi:esterase|uniref:alpha/beta fold hydrolase n=1 Tax=Halothiobacillus sp. 15-55-196 TaxID=1970382 RepID=UPI000BCDBAC6|nr:alpha/beta fold hydrolase [Halothiobacillus sp. 15-55-196]OZB36950.1 MAG: hypothetical protein B7X44_03820 [Halothiobacillus sp. 15-55-196]OZB56668.1 MAG: hypothetical protein B7X35_04585 [Halothiobacillus sp. 14-56-357]OZB78902.1 MAG: hypothetical protein B7X29_03020 [Halothiobacillus sp. 13-55-115]